MIDVIDQILSEVSSDKRITHGIFRMEEESHMDALRDYFVNSGVPKLEAVGITNRMLEGKFPERQAYNADGVLVTFPTPKHKALAIKRGTHFEKSPIANEKPAPEPSEKPIEKPIPSLPNSPEKSDAIEPASSEEKPAPNIFHPQGLEAEPVNNLQSAKELPKAIPTIPQTPESIAASKEIIKQIINTDNTSIGNINNIPISEECNKQLKELYAIADKMELREAVSFLTHYVEP